MLRGLTGESKIVRIAAFASFLMCSLLIIGSATPALARDVEYTSGEIRVHIQPGEPTQVSFPDTIAGGYKKANSAISIDKRGKDLIIFANEALSQDGESLLVRLEDGRSYSLRTHRATKEFPRDAVVKIEDERGSLITADEEETPPYADKRYDFAPPSKVSGLMREMVLVSEFGKSSIQGYQVSEKHRGQVVIDDGTLVAKIDKIFLGPNLWGYVLEAENKLGQTQLINPASFRLHGTRAVSMQRWELAPQPLTVENQVAAKHRGKVYIITKAKR